MICIPLGKAVWNATAGTKTRSENTRNTKRIQLGIQESYAQDTTAKQKRKCIPVFHAFLLTGSIGLAGRGLKSENTGIQFKKVIREVVLYLLFLYSHLYSKCILLYSSLYTLYSRATKTKEVGG